MCPSYCGWGPACRDEAGAVPLMRSSRATNTLFRTFHGDRRRAGISEWHLGRRVVGILEWHLGRQLVSRPECLS